MIFVSQQMKQKIAITLDQELIAFLDSEAQGNRSEYLNSLLAQKRQEKLAAQLIQALQQDVEDADYQAEIAAWDHVAGDGIDAQG